MDNKQRQSIIRHLSQKIFVNKVSKINFLSYEKNDAHETMKDVAGESLLAAKIFVKELEIEMEDQDETDVPS